MQDLSVVSILNKNVESDAKKELVVTISNTGTNAIYIIPGQNFAQLTIYN